MKKIIALILTAVMAFSMICPSIAATPAFPDIEDEETAKAAAVLQMLGVIQGDGGKFYPAGKLTRAEFCKMAVVLMGKGSQEAQNRSRTLFPDVRSDHWARGFINIAATGESRLIAGYSDGMFKPDEQITYAQAITILLRMLGYSDEDAGLLWPEDHIRLAETAGLTENITVSAREPIARRDAARLFVNMLSAKTKGGEKYCATLGTVVDNVIILELDAVLPGGTAEGIKTTSGVYSAKNGVVPEILLGKRGTMIIEDGQAVTIIPDTAKSLTLAVTDANSTWVKAMDGKQHDIPSGTKVYTADGEYSFVEKFPDISSGTLLTLYYNKGGTVDAVYMEQRVAESAVIVMSQSASPGVFSGITNGAADISVYRNGVLASFGDIRKYDVATFNKASRALSVSDFRITAFYESASPNPEYPSSVRFLGKEFPVLPSARETLSEYRPGDVLTFLLSADNQVAGVLPTSEVTAVQVGIVESVSPSSATVTLLNGMTFTGNPDLTSEQAERTAGEIVSVSSSKAGGLNISRLVTSGGYAIGPDLSAMTYGTMKISAGVRIFDKINKSGIVPVEKSDLMQSRIHLGDILYIGTDSGGYVNLIVTNDITGDLYQYGFLEKRFPSEDDTNRINRAAVTNSEGTTPFIYAVQDFKGGEAGGLVLSADGSTVTAIAPLTKADNIRRSAFKTVGTRLYVTVSGSEIPVAENVQCYNKTSGLWFSSIEEARAFSDTLTVYYDRPPQENGKIRLVVTG